MRKQSEIERMFNDEVRDKKRVGSNIYARTGTRGYTGTIRSAHDLLKGRAKKLYEGNSKVMTTNIYDKIIPREEFDQLEPHIQKNMYAYWYLTHGINKIKDGMGIGNQTVYTYLDRLGIERKGLAQKVPREKTTRRAYTKKPKQVNQKESIQLSLQENKVTLPLIEPAVIPQPVKIDGFSLAYNGSYNAAQLEKILNKIALIVSEEENDFELELRLVEKK